jgi:nitrous oxidase accessory protein
MVCPDCDLKSLNAAVAQARPNDRIRIRAGRYRDGPTVIDKPLEIVGEGFPILDGEGAHEVLTIRADRVRVRGLVVQNSGMSFADDVAGIKVERCRGCVIEGNRLVNTFFGIYVAESSECLVRDNVILGNADSESFSGNGIHLWNATDMRLVGNRVSGHRDGIYLEFVRASAIVGNTSEKNLRYGLHFMFSEGNDYRANAFRRNGAGVAVMYSRQVTMVENAFEENWGPAAYGLLLKDIDDSRIVANTFRQNTVALYAEGSNRIAVEGNAFVRNGWAIRVMANSMGMTFTQNNFIGNTFDVTTNSSRTFNTFVQNYWDQYKGYDLNRDGIGDVPYRPVRLFALLIETYPEAILLLRSPMIEFLEVAERVIPVFTPQVLADQRPLMRAVRWSKSTD